MVKLLKKKARTTNPVVTVRKVKEKKTSSFVVMTKGSHGSADKAQTIKFDEDFIQGTILGGQKKTVDYDSISQENKTAMIKTWGSVATGVEALRKLTVGDYQNVYAPMLELQKQMQSVSKSLRPLMQQQEELRAKLNPIMQGKSMMMTGSQKIKERLEAQIKEAEKQQANFKKKLSKTELQSRVATSGIMSLLNSNYQDRFPNLKGHRANGAKRMALTGVGMGRIMTKHKLSNPVAIAKVYPKHQKDLNISGFINLRYLCEQMNVDAEEAFLYVCEGMTSNNTRWLNHKVIKELDRGSLGIVNLVDYYDDKNKQHRNSNKPKYSIKSLYASTYYKDWCIEYDIKKMSYVDFTKKFKEFQKTTKNYHTKYPKGLLG